VSACFKNFLLICLTKINNRYATEYHNIFYNTITEANFDTSTISNGEWKGEEICKSSSTINNRRWRRLESSNFVEESANFTHICYDETQLLNVSNSFDIGNMVFPLTIAAILTIIGKLYLFMTSFDYLLNKLPLQLRIDILVL